MTVRGCNRSCSPMVKLADFNLACTPLSNREYLAARILNVESRPSGGGYARVRGCSIGVVSDDKLNGWSTKLRMTKRFIFVDLTA